MTMKTEPCWTVGCGSPATHDYWCEQHHTERRERIKSEMAKIKNDSHGIPRNYGGIGRPYTTEELEHTITVTGNFYGWRWACSCGKGSAADAKTKSLATSASARHIRAIQKAAA